VLAQPFGMGRTRRYEELVRDFRWDIPATFNFATDVVDAWAEARDGPALIAVDAAGATRTLSFLDISRASARLADVLRRGGVGKGDRVIVVMPRIAEWPIAMVACTRIGAVAIPCIEMLTARDLAYRVENSGASAILCRAGQVEKFAGLEARVPLRLALGARAAGLAAHLAAGWLDLEEAMAGAGEAVAPADVAAEDPVVMYYTSGSTGHPKGVLHAARALWAWRVQAWTWLDLEPGDRIWCTADTGWSKAGTSILWGPWSCGATAFLFDGPFSPAGRLELLARHGITHYCAPATELYRVVQERVAAHDLSRLRRTVSAGEAMNPVVADAWQRATGVTVAEAYGLTESLMLVLNYPSEPVKYGSMGRPQPGLDVDILDEAGRRLPAGEEGDIALRLPAPQMMLGYWQDPERTASVLREGPEGRWQITGDRGRKDADGYFWYAGRADDIINSAGYRIGPLEVENVLLEHPAVLECAVVSSPDPERGEIVKAFIVTKPGRSGDAALAAELQAHVKAVTAPYKYPRAVAFVPELPKTVTGKIRRRELRDREWA
jgi:acyl-coenzyme A synthetase/AMP-(fatty) acid ligase